ncbi:conserved hypothetical protein [delta proteobacterium NaphS2]|nr:conserved hypothetical protein [delta proteobacterium NaphS2]
MDLEEAKRKFEPYRQKIADMQAQADALTVDSDESQETAVESAAQAKRLLKALDEERKRLIKDPDQFVRSMNAFVRSFRKPLDALVGTLRGKIGDFQYQKELERRKIAKKMEEEAAARKAKLEAEAKESGVEPPQVMPVPAPKPDTTTRTESGATASIRTQWVGEIQDPQAVPREYCCPDQKAIDQAVKLGVREIPGVKIYEKPITVLRS